MAGGCLEWVPGTWQDQAGGITAVGTGLCVLGLPMLEGKENYAIFFFLLKNFVIKGRGLVKKRQ